MAGGGGAPSMRVVGIFWSRIVGPVVGLALFFLMLRWGGGMRGIMLGLAAYLAACWWGERFWLARADAEEARLALEERRRNPPE